MEKTATPIADSKTHSGHHHEQGFISKYVFSADHKVIGIQYAITSLLFLFFGYGLMALMRWQLAYPGKPIPVFGSMLTALLGEDMASGGIMSPDLYNSFAIFAALFLPEFQAQHLRPG